MGSCQNYGPFLDTLNNRCRIIIGTQKGTIILTTTHIELGLEVPKVGVSDFEAYLLRTSYHLLSKSPDLQAELRGKGGSGVRAAREAAKSKVRQSSIMGLSK